MDHVSGLPPTHPVLRVAAEVEAAVKSVAGVEPAFMEVSDKRAGLVALARARDLVDGLLMRLLAVCDDVAEETGARDVVGWLAPEARLDRGAVAGSLRTGRSLAARWRLVETALGEGRVNVAQARVIATCLDDVAAGLSSEAGPSSEAAVSAERREQLLAQAEAQLVDLAALHGPRELRRLGERILSLVAPGVEEERERKALEDAERRASAATSLRMRRRGDGSTDLFARLPDHAAARLKTCLDAFTSPRVSSRGTDDRDPATGERLPAPRLAGEAFVALLESLDPARLPVHGGAATTLVVTIDLEALMSGLGEGVTGDGTRLSAGQVRRLACQAGHVPVVLGGASRPLDVGRKRRLYDSAQRTALTLQHASCQAHGCEVPSTWCEVHHRVPFSRGGRTDLADGMVLCSWHHHRIHDPAYRHRLMPDGGVRFARRT